MRYLIALMLLVLVGCATPKVNFTPSGSSSLPAYNGEILVIDRLPEKYNDIGWVSCDAPAHTPPGDLLVMVKNKAREAGANTIVYNENSFKLTYAQAVIFCRAINQER